MEPLDGSEGWLRTSRRLHDPQYWLHPRSRGGPACDAFAYEDIVALARWKDGDGLKRGQVRAAESFLASRWHWSQSRVHRFLVELKRRGLIDRKAGRGRRPALIEVIGYDILQASPAELRPKRNPNSKLKHTVRRNGPGHDRGFPDSRSSSRSSSRSASRSTNDSEEKDEGNFASRGGLGTTRAGEGRWDKLCPECGQVEIPDNRDSCSRCERLNRELAASFPDEPRGSGRELPPLPF